MRKSMKKSAIVMLTLAAFTMSAVGEAQARIGSSRSSSTSSTSSARSSSIGSSSSRIGGGSSMGMQRSTVMNSVRSQPRSAPAPSYAPSYRQAPAPAPSYAQSYRQAPAPTPSPSQASPSKRSWVAPAAAGVAAGALAGYALANSNNHSQPAAPAPQYQQPAPQYQQPAPQYQQQAPAYADQAPAPAPAPVYSQAAPAPAPAYAPAAAPAPAYAAAPQSSGGFGFGSFLLLLALIGACIFGYRRYVMRKGDIQADARRTGNAAKASVDAFKSSFNASEPAPAAPTKSAVDMGKATSSFASEAELDRVGQDLMATAEQFYKELQDLNNKGDLTTLRNRIGDDGLFNDLADAVRTRTTASQTEVVSLQADLVDLSDEGNRFVGSVRYQGLVKEGPYQAAENVDEVFHFVKDKSVLGSWKLAGIEQVEEA